MSDQKSEVEPAESQKPLPGGETTTYQLRQALRYETSESKCPPGFDPDIDDPAYFKLQQEVDCDEVYPQIFIGDGVTAKNKDYLKKIGITHVLNAAEGKGFGYVKTNADFYNDTEIKYHGCQMLDFETTNITKFFDGAAEFIDQGVSTGGRVYVHCHQGISRSSTLVIAYLMIKKGLSAYDAIRSIKMSRCIRPNDGFLQQLAQLDNKLRRIELESA